MEKGSYKNNLHDGILLKLWCSIKKPNFLYPHLYSLTACQKFNTLFWSPGLRRNDTIFFSSPFVFWKKYLLLDICSVYLHTAYFCVHSLYFPKHNLCSQHSLYLVYCVWLVINLILQSPLVHFIEKKFVHVTIDFFFLNTNNKRA